MFRERLPQRSTRGLAAAAGGLGPLERRVLEWLWARQDPASVRDVHADFPGTAYTTLMTTLDRLYRKGVLDRLRDGRAFLYWPQFSNQELAEETARQSIARLLGDGVLLRPVLSTLVDTVTQQDAAALDELELLVRARRRARDRGEFP